MKNNPLLSVVIATYNHEPYISQAIESVLAQETTYPFQIIITDDASTDRTPEIVREYADRHPEIIHPTYLKENHERGGLAHFAARPNVSTPYVAMLSGDDYYCAKGKLQKQLDFLEHNPDFVGCSHNTRIIHEGSDRPPVLMRKDARSEWTIHDMIKGRESFYCHVSSWVWRNVLGDEDFFLPNEYKTNPEIYRGDTVLFYLYAQHGKMKYFNDVMSVYRITKKGVWSELSQQNRDHNNLILLWRKLNTATEFKYDDRFKSLEQRGWRTYRSKYSLAQRLTYAIQTKFTRLLRGVGSI